MLYMWIYKLNFQSLANDLRNLTFHFLRVKVMNK